MLKKNLTVCLWDVRLQSLANRPPRCSILAFEHTRVYSAAQPLNRTKRTADFELNFSSVDPGKVGV